MAKNLPLEIEVFRVGGAASRGITADQIAEVASFDCGSNPVPVCFGHPKSDTPAAGLIEGFRAEGNSLFAKVKNFTDEAIDGIKNGAWLNRSMAFFDPHHEANPRPGKWSPRHLGLLGGAAPGIPGMGSLQKALAFNAEDDIVTVEGDPADAVVYAGKATPVHFVSTEEAPNVPELTPEQIADYERLKAGEQSLTTREQAIATRLKTSFEANNASMIDALVAAGKVLPAEADDLKTVFNAFDPEGDELTFGAGDKATKGFAAAKLGAFLSAALPKRIPTQRTSPAGEFTAPEQNDDPRSIDVRARELMEKDKSLTFEAAVEKVSGGGNVEA